jgi:type II secretory pathway component PulK
LRKGIGLIWALIVLLLIASLMTAVTKIAFFSVKHTSDTYMIQRAQLFIQSAVENAILAIEGYDRSSGWIS